MSVEQIKIITAKANKWVNELLDTGQPSIENPFFINNNEMYMKFDSINVFNSSKHDGQGLDVCYYWRGDRVCKFVVKEISLQMAGDVSTNHLTLDGISGCMKMVLI